MPALPIESGPVDDYYGLIFSVDLYRDGSVYRAIVRTPHGFVIGSSMSVELTGDAAFTKLDFIFNGREFSTRIDGKQYKPQGMVQLAKAFVAQCLSA